MLYRSSGTCQYLEGSPLVSSDTCLTSCHRCSDQHSGNSSNLLEHAIFATWVFALSTKAATLGSRGSRSKDCIVDRDSNAATLPLPGLWCTIFVVRQLRQGGFRVNTTPWTMIIDFTKRVRMAYNMEFIVICNRRNSRYCTWYIF